MGGDEENWVEDDLDFLPEDSFRDESEVGDDDSIPANTNELHSAIGAENLGAIKSIDDRLREHKSNEESAKRKLEDLLKQHAAIKTKSFALETEIEKARSDLTIAEKLVAQTEEQKKNSLTKGATRILEKAQ